MFKGFLSKILPSAGKAAKAKVASKLAGRLAKIVRNQYDALQTDYLRRRQIVRSDRTKTQQDFTADRRIQAYTLADVAYDNDQLGAIIDTCIRLTIGTRGGRPFFTGDNAAEYQKIWNTWARSCGHQENENWQEILGIILRAVKVHGDCIILVDPDLTGNKVRLWDADQICNITDADFNRWGDEHGLETRGDIDAAIYRQVEGAVTDPTGRVIGYFVTHRRNQYAVSLEQATFLPIDLCRRVGSRVKISQYRGEPSTLPTAELTEDTRSLIKSEVAAAKNYSETSLILERPATDSGDGILASLTGADGEVDEDLIAAAGLQPGDVDGLLQAVEKKEPQTQGAFFEGKSAIGWVDNGTGIHELNNANRPSPQIQAWQDRLADINGQRQGAMSCLARGRADNSYSSGQIEISVSWAKFAEDQKMLERYVIDYVVERICPGAEYVVNWPDAFEIDPQKAEDTRDARLRSGRESFQQQCGADWRVQIDQLAEFVNYCKEKGVDPARFAWYGQTAAGNATPSAEPIASPDGNMPHDLPL